MKPAKKIPSMAEALEDWKYLAKEWKDVAGMFYGYLCGAAAALGYGEVRSNFDGKKLSELPVHPVMRLRGEAAFKKWPLEDVEGLPCFEPGAVSIALPQGFIEVAVSDVLTCFSQALPLEIEQLLECCDALKKEMKQRGFSLVHFKEDAAFELHRPKGHEVRGSCGLEKKRQAQILKRFAESSRKPERRVFKLEIKGRRGGVEVCLSRELECSSRHEARVICYDVIVMEGLSDARFEVDGEPEGAQRISITG